MSDLRKAAEMALEVLEHFSKGESPAITKKELVYEIAALRKALAQYENVGDYQQTTTKSYSTKRKWVGIDEKEVAWLWFWMGNREKINGYDFAKAIEAKLKERNS